MYHRRNLPQSGCLLRPLLPSGSAAGVHALQLPNLSVPLSAAAAGMSAGQRTAVHPAVQVCLTSKQDGMLGNGEALVMHTSSDMESLW